MRLLPLISTSRLVVTHPKAHLISSPSVVTHPKPHLISSPSVVTHPKPHLISSPSVVTHPKPHGLTQLRLNQPSFHVTRSLATASTSNDTKSDNPEVKPSILSKLAKLFRFERKPPAGVVSVIRFSGSIADNSEPIGQSISLRTFNKRIETAFEVKNLKAVCLQINSPGGSPVQSELVAKRIQSLASEKELKVYAFVEDVGASGGYFIACAANEIYASESSIVGSIGVVSFRFGLQDVIKRFGIEPRFQTAGENKLLNDPFSAETEKGVAKTEETLAALHQHFISFVKGSRGERLKAEESLLFSGEFWTGKGALEVGLIDGLDDMHSFIRKQFGKDVKVKEFKKKTGLQAILGGGDAAAQTMAQVVVSEFYEEFERRFFSRDPRNEFKMKS